MPAPWQLWSKKNQSLWRASVYILCTGWCCIQAVHLEEASRDCRLHRAGAAGELTLTAVPVLGLLDEWCTHLGRPKDIMVPIRLLQGMAGGVAVVAGPLVRRGTHRNGQPRYDADVLVPGRLVRVRSVSRGEELYAQTRISSRISMLSPGWPGRLQSSASFSPASSITSADRARRSKCSSGCISSQR